MGPITSASQLTVAVLTGLVHSYNSELTPKTNSFCLQYVHILGVFKEYLNETQWLMGQK